MTKAEAIEYLEKNIKLHEIFNETKHQEKAIEALNMAIDALAKEPEDDCVSREWVMDLYKEWKPMLATNVDGFGYALKHAPSVVPKREIPPNMKQVLIPKHCIVTPNDAVPSTGSKRGHWLEAREEDPCWYRCSECGRLYDLDENYCPNCGARMESDEE